MFKVEHNLVKSFVFVVVKTFTFILFCLEKKIFRTYSDSQIVYSLN